MKKLMILAATAAVVLASCAKSEVYQNTREENAIAFGVYAGKTPLTKATYGDITTDNLKTSADGFGVFAYYTQADDWAATFKPNFMYNQKVKYNESANTTLYPAKWEYTPLKYWPNGQNSTTVEAGTYNDKLSFFAYAPHYASFGTEGVTAISANNVAGVPVVSFTVPAKAEEQVDLLWANPVLDLTKQSLTGTVNFNFKHALAKLNVKVQAVVDAVNPTTATLDAKTKIVLESLEIKANGTKSGKLSIGSGNATPNWTDNSGESVVTYTEDSFAATTTVNGKTGFNVTETATWLNETKSPMIIPAAIAAGDFVITANYWVITDDAALDGGYATVQQVIKKTSADVVTFEAGKKYTVLVCLGLTNVIFAVTEVAAWTDAVGPTVDLPVNFN